MGKIYAFLLGVLAGFGLYHLAMSYHVVRAESGLHLVSKVSPQLDDTYVDIRGFTPAAAAEHVGLLAAIEQSGNEDLKAEVRGGLIEGGINQALDLLKPKE